MLKKVLVVMGSDSDFPVMAACINMLVDFGIEHDVRICSAHRSPVLASQMACSAAKDGYGVIIAAAGLAAHLPGIIAAYTILPVIGVPIMSGALAGQDALYAIVQMPAGIPVAAVAIDGAANAAILAIQILAVHDEYLQLQLLRYKQKLVDSVNDRQQRLDEQLATGKA